MTRPTIRSTRRAALVGCGVAIAMLATGCGGQDASSSASGDDNSAGPVAVKIAVQPLPDFCPVWLGVSQGLFTDQDINVEIVPGTATSSGQIPLLSSGQTDLAATTAAAALQASAQGIDVSIVGGLTSFGTSTENDPSGLITAPKSPIGSFTDLVGKTVAVSGLKSLTQAGIEAAVDQAGGDPSKVKFIQIPMPNIPSTVATGGADAGFVVDPFLGGALAKGLQLVGKPFSDVAAGYPTTSLVATKSYADSHADVLKRFNSALSKAADYCNAHPDEARKATAKGAKVPLKMLKGSQNPVFDSEVDPALLAKEAQLLHKYGALSKPVNAESIVWNG